MPPPPIQPITLRKRLNFRQHFLKNYVILDKTIWKNVVVSQLENINTI